MKETIQKHGDYYKVWKGKRFLIINLMTGRARFAYFNNSIDCQERFNTLKEAEEALTELKAKE